jgi:exopolyphosphatase / guanosine-5'-triphosphate,3'-diphosphate pyrophosphatase
VVARRRMRVAAIDCGTNSVRLLVRDGDRELHREMRIVRLGQDVDRTGTLAPEAIERTRVALAAYADVIADLKVSRVRMIATSATRDATNRDVFTAMVQHTLGVEPEVISGGDEAALSYAGAVTTMSELEQPVLLVDLGGGSTELVMGPEPLRAHSMDVGSVRMTERHLHDDPPTSEQIEAVVRDVSVALDRAQHDVPWQDAKALVGVAGTITTVAAVVLDLDEYRPEAVHGLRLTADQIGAVADRLLSLDHAGRAAIKAIHPGRVDVIGAGALVLRVVLERSGAAELVVSEHDILDGVALSIG